MTTVDIITARSRAIMFFGTEDYEKMLFSAQEYMKSQGRTLSVYGVEAEPAFWEVVNYIMDKSVNGDV